MYREIIHGNPSWSFEYRRLIRHFARTHRCIAIDHLGFGLSDKPANASYLPQWHAANLRRFITELDLHNVTLVMQDWGGPIGIAAMLDHPARLSGLVAFNSWFFDVREHVILRRFSRIVGSAIGRFLCIRFNLFPRVLLKASFGDSSQLTTGLHQQYLAPFRSRSARKGTWTFPRSIVNESEWLKQLWARRATLAKLPALLVWGMKDDAFAPLLVRWQQVLPQQHSLELPAVGHNVAEEAGEAIIPVIAQFLAVHDL